jgi:hypothetical protein
MVSKGILSKDQDHRKFKQWLEALEDQNRLLITLVSWLVKHHGVSFHISQDERQLVGDSMDVGHPTNTSTPSSQVPHFYG